MHFQIYFSQTTASATKATKKDVNKQKDLNFLLQMIFRWVVA